MNVDLAYYVLKIVGIVVALSLDNKVSGCKRAPCSKNQTKVFYEKTGSDVSSTKT